jgi:threonine/homoserine/homoserine lactone efflux protein
VLIALLSGLGLGFAGSVPVAGPTAVVVVESGLQNRPRRGLAVATGAAVAESIYALIAFWGLTTVLNRYPMLRPASRVVAGVVLVLVGLYLMVRKPKPTRSSEGSGAERRAHELIFGFTITIVNPTLFVTWTVAVAALHSVLSRYFQFIDGPAFAIGAGIGIVAWFWLLLKLVCRFRRGLSPETLQRVIHVTGAILSLIGLVVVIRSLFKLHAME